MQLGHLKHIKKFINDDVSTYYFNELKTNIPWETVTWRGNKKLPRLVHKYEGNIDVLDELSKLITDSFIVNVEGIWCNYYRNGSDYTPEHQDSYGANVFTLSFGSSRDFYFRNIETKERINFRLRKGDLYFFDQETNSKYTHSIPKRKDAKERISIVFFTSEPSSVDIIDILSHTSLD